MNSSIFKKIMVATDGSELTKKAVDSAIETAKLCKAKLYDVYVFSLEGYSMTPSRDIAWEKAMKEQLIIEGNEATTYVENTGRATNIEVESVILEGSPVDEIVDFADKNDIDLIVMGTQGKNVTFKKSGTCCKGRYYRKR